MLSLYVLEKDCTLNNFKHDTSTQVVAGETLKLRLRFWQPERGIRYIPAVGATIEMSFATSDPDVSITKTGTNPFADDRSIFDITFTAEEAETLISQNLIVTLTEDSDVTVARLQNGLQKVPLTNGC